MACSPEDVCPRLLELIPTLPNRTIGIIAEIKGGAAKPSSLNEYKLASCIKRLGLIEGDQLLAEAIQGSSGAENYVPSNGSIAIHKIFVDIANADIPHWGKIQLRVMIDFIKSRIHKYREKGKAWNHYGSNLFQYLLYEDGLL